jgi:hypothetical protein
VFNWKIKKKYDALLPPLKAWIGNAIILNNSFE